jgi:transcriptional regulator with XRE-family HTH domain
MPTGRPNHYLRTERRSAGLSQVELGLLLGVSDVVVANVENERHRPSFAFVLGCTLLFGKSAESLFPYLYNTVQENVQQQAVALDERLRGRTDAYSRKKLAFLHAYAISDTPARL